MDMKLVLIVAAIVAVLYQQGKIDLSKIAQNRNILVALMAVVVGYYVFIVKGVDVPLLGSVATKTESYCGMGHTSSKAEAFEDEEENDDERSYDDENFTAQEGLPMASGNFLNGTRHAKMFEQITPAALPYVAGTTVAPSAPHAVPTKFSAKYDIRETVAVPLNEAQVPFGQSSVAAVVASGLGTNIPMNNIRVTSM